MTVTALLEIARGCKLMIATAESCTGGMLASAITEIPGSSDVFDRGFVTYSNAAKNEMLGVPLETIEKFGAVSEEVARKMAEGAIAHSRASIALSITGIAGPGGSECKPEGCVCFGLAIKGKPTVSQTREFGAIGRAKVRMGSRENALLIIQNALIAYKRGIL